MLFFPCDKILYIYAMKKFLLFFFASILMTSAFAQTDKMRYTGVYKFPDGSVISTIEVLLQDSALQMASSAGASPLAWIKDDEFTITNFSGVATFKRNSEGKVVGVHIEAMGYVLDGTKQEVIPQPFWSDKLVNQFRGCSTNNGVVAPFLLKPITTTTPLYVKR